MRCETALLAAAVLTACGDDPIRVGKSSAEADYHRGELGQAIDRFIAAGRTAPAFGQLATEVLALRPGMDEMVAAEAERRLLVLALEPMEATAKLPLDERVAAQATTIWPFGLRRPLDEPRVMEGPLAAREAALVVRGNETPAAYLLRLCGDALAIDCKLAVPELQGAVVGPRVVEELSDRASRAMTACQACESEPAWGKAVERWAVLQHAAAEHAHRDAERAMPARWPTAGAGAGECPPLPTVMIDAIGETLLAGEPIGARRVAALRAARQGTVLRVHLPPEARAEQLAALLGDAAAAGYSSAVVEAREGSYPWPLRGYRFATKRGGARSVPWRPSDTLQVVLRAVDALPGGGASGEASLD